MLGNIGKEIGKEVAEGLAKKVIPKVMNAAKKPLEWGFKGRKQTDISDSQYPTKKDYEQDWEKLVESAKRNPNTRQADFILRNIKSDEGDKKFLVDSLHNAYKRLENEGVPRELTGKLWRHPLGDIGLQRITNKIRSGPSEYDILNNKKVDIEIKDWKSGWLRYYNELNEAQKETFDALSDGWQGNVNELVDTVKRLA